MKSDRFVQLMHFVEVARQRGFTQAAGVLGVSASSVSRSVSRLEERLGVRLVQRTSRSVSLTEAGQAYFMRCGELLAQLDAADAMADNTSQDMAGRIRLSVPTGLTDARVMPALATFMTAHPRIQVELFAGNRYVDLIDEGYDLAIRVGDLPESEQVARRIGDNRRVLVATPHYLEIHGSPVKPADLADHAGLQLGNAPPAAAWTFQQGSHEVRVHPRSTLLCNHAAAIRLAALAHLGVATPPSMLVEEDIRQRALVQLLPDWTLPPQPIHAIFPSNRHIPAKVRMFVDHLASVLEQHERQHQGEQP
jgi:DNA-binding transcriptional LysR family regulator